MKTFFNKTFRFLNFRLLLNILFAAILGFIIFSGNVPDKHIVTVNLCKAISVVSLLLFTYTNNLFLVPKFLAGRRYRIYFFWAFLLVIIYAVSYSIFIEAVLHKYPDIKSYQIVLLSVPFEKEWTVGAIMGCSIGYAVTYAVWLLILTMAWYVHDYSRQQKLMAGIQKKQLETELSFLKNQINPHFLFNTLNNLYALALQKSDAAPDAILKLSSILRYLLYESNTHTVSFEKEKEIMQAYIDIELLRLDHADRLQFSITADKPYQVPPLLWLPVLENIFKHGTRTIAEDNQVVFHFEIKDNMLSIYSKNKEKMLAKSNAEQGGIGLKNLEKRLELLFPGKHALSVLQENNYYISQVKIALS